MLKRIRNVSVALVNTQSGGVFDAPAGKREIGFGGAAQNDTPTTGEEGNPSLKVGKGYCAIKITEEERGIKGKGLESDTTGR